MEPLTIVKALKIGKDDGSGLGARFEAIAVQAFSFKLTPDTPIGALSKQL
jgi:hypothetical protein